MPYIALYRKYRPITYKEVVGQESIIKILKNQVQLNKISHAYIFSGSRGTGKTTIAKIFARAVNCENNLLGEPCGICESCKSILEGKTTDVIEMDAASNNSVDNIRAIRQEVMYATTGLKYKVYIIDEVHMLSTSAFNALLKTLEEPPEGVIFILATTEEHKIIPTILSRCIRFNFKKLTKAEIVSKLKEILKDMKIDYEEEVLMYIANLADGAVRDALSILERCIEAETKKITLEYVKEIIGDTNQEIITEVIKNIIEYNICLTEKTCDKIIKDGKDLRYINTLIIEKIMNIMILCANNEYDLLEENLKNIAKNVSINRYNYLIKELSYLDDVLRQGINNQIIFKAKLIELASNIILNDSLSMEEKIKNLELKIEKLESERKIINIKEPQEEVLGKPEKVLSEIQELPKETSKEVKKESKKMKDIMKLALEKDRLKLYSALSSAEGFELDNTIKLVFKNDFAYSVVRKNDEYLNLQEIIKQIMGNDTKIIIEYESSKKYENKSEFEKIMDESKIKYENID